MKDVKATQDKEGLISELSRASQGRLAGSWIDLDGTVRVRLTRGSQLRSVEDIVAKSRFKIALAYDATATINEKVAAVASSQVQSWLAMNRTTVVGVSAQEKTDDLLFYATSESPVVDLDARKTSVAGTLVSLLQSQGIGYKFKSVRGTAFNPENRGGRNMTSCTSGFTFKVGANGQKQLVLARHCKAQDYYFFSGAGPYDTNYTGKKYDAYADLQWRYPVSHTARGTFYADSTSGDGRYQSGEDDRTQDQGICHRGKTTGYSCGTVINRFYAPNYPCGDKSVPCASTYVRVAGAVSAGGDSGGPWFFGTTAYGIHNGTSGGDRVYSKLGYLPTILFLVIE